MLIAALAAVEHPHPRIESHRLLSIWVNDRMWNGEVRLLRSIFSRMRALVPSKLDRYGANSFITDQSYSLENNYLADFKRAARNPVHIFNC